MHESINHINTMCVSDVLELRLQAMEQFAIDAKKRAIFVQSGVLFAFAAAFCFLCHVAFVRPHHRLQRYPNGNVNTQTLTNAKTLTLK